MDALGEFNLTLNFVAVILTIIVAAGTVLGYVWRKVVKPINGFVDDVQIVKEQLHPNGGDSLRDAVDNAHEAAVTAASEAIEGRREVNRHTSQDDRRFELVDKKFGEHDKRFDSLGVTLESVDKRLANIEARSTQHRSTD